MEKKNPYVMTIGFKKEDPDHIMVAELLNSMGRGKAQYIVKAVLVYQNLQQSGELPQTVGVPYDYGTIRHIVRQILDEREGKINSVFPSPREQVQKPESEKEKDLLEGFDEVALNGLMESIAAFQNQ